MHAFWLDSWVIFMNVARFWTSPAHVIRATNQCSNCASLRIHRFVMQNKLVDPAVCVAQSCCCWVRIIGRRTAFATFVTLESGLRHHTPMCDGGIISVLPASGVDLIYWSGQEGGHTHTNTRARGGHDSHSSSSFQWSGKNACAPRVTCFSTQPERMRKKLCYVTEVEKVKR